MPLEVPNNIAWCIVKLTIPFTLPSGVDTLIPIDTVPLSTKANYDPFNCFVPGSNQIALPNWASEVKVIAHVGYPIQNLLSASCGIHLFRNGAFTGEAFYHVHVPYPAGLTQILSVVAITPFIPVLSPGETWTMLGHQDTGAGIQVVTGPETWLAVNFR